MRPGTDDLPDGLWYGLVADFTSDGISFDLACWFTGDAATAAAAEDGEESPPPNDYYVRNQNQQLREVEVAADTPVLWYLSGDPDDSRHGTFSEWTEFLQTQAFRLGVWVTISDGKVTEIESSGCRNSLLTNDGQDHLQGTQRSGQGRAIGSATHHV